jgi:hypothetical protein
LEEIQNNDKLKARTFFGIGSIATVPLPGAIWLFAGGLTALGAFRRRRVPAREAG